MGVPPHRMRVRQPPEKIGELRIRLRTDDEVPVIRHHGVRENRQGLSLERLFQNAIEGFIVFLLLKQRQPSHSAVKHVEANISGANTRSSGHGR